MPLNMFYSSEFVTELNGVFQCKIYYILH